VLQGVTVDESKMQVRLPVRTQRSTIIIRDIKATNEEIAQIFNVDGAPGKAVSVRADIGDTWFVSFENEDIAVRSLLWLQSQKFNGKPIRARIKSETQQKSL
jgi:hypothetical protein